MIHLVANCASTCANHMSGSVGQKGGSFRAMALTAPAGASSVIVGVTNVDSIHGALAHVSFPLSSNHLSMINHNKNFWHVLIACLYTIDWEFFALKIFRRLNFRRN